MACQGISFEISRINIFGLRSKGAEVPLAPEEKSQTQDRRIIVSISRSRLAAWRLPKEDLIRVLFEYGKRHVAELVKTNQLATGYTIRFPTITTASHADSTCPFDAALIEA